MVASITLADKRLEHAAMVVPIRSDGGILGCSATRWDVLFVEAVCIVFEARVQGVSEHSRFYTILEVTFIFTDG